MPMSSCLIAYVPVALQDLEIGSLFQGNPMPQPNAPAIRHIVTKNVRALVPCTTLCICITNAGHAVTWSLHITLLSCNQFFMACKNAGFYGIRYSLKWCTMKTGAFWK